MFEIKLYDCTLLEEQDVFQAKLALVGEHRQQKVMSYAMGKSQRLSLGAGLLLEEYLHSLGLSEADLAFGTQGKAFLPSYPDCHFNLSHGGDYAVLATGDRPLGVDIEKIKENRFPMGQRCFAPEEVAQIANCSGEEEKNHLFFRLWVMKESYLKATGKGLSLGLKSFAVDGETKDFLYPETGYSFHEVSPPLLGYVMALCQRKKDRKNDSV
ncbi:MAG: 4'-phosphopantetheinyl transferase superfamily protein [Eubacteriales bacterium]